MWSAQFNDPSTDFRNALVTDRQSADDFSSRNNLQPESAFSMLINRTANNANGVVSVTPYFDTGVGGPGQAGARSSRGVVAARRSRGVTICDAVGRRPGESAAFVL
jgi:hypothetical protein